jgi:hypothetical protein
MEPDYYDTGVWLGKRKADSLALQILDLIPRIDAKHHVVMIDRKIWHLQTETGDKNGRI